MKLYRDQNDAIYAYEEDGSQDNLIGDKIPITQQEAEILKNARQTTEYAELDYAEKRRLDYPYIGDQLDALYHAGVFPPEMAERIRRVKEMHPKTS